jgi:hypothetical protein
VREFGDDSVKRQTAFDRVQEVTFNAESGKWGRNSGHFGVGLNAKLTERVNFRFDYDFEIYNHTSAGVASAALGVKW